MQSISNFIVNITMISFVIAILSTIVKPEHELSIRFKDGLISISSLIIPITGIMSSIPLLSHIIQTFISPIFSKIGSDSSIAVAMLLAADLGGYQLSEAVSSSTNIWALSFYLSFTIGATISFTIPVALNMIDDTKKASFYQGISIGLISIPVGALFYTFILNTLNVKFRSNISVNSSPDQLFYLPLKHLIFLLLPVLIFVIIIYILMNRYTKTMVMIFNKFAILIDIYTKFVFMIVVIHYFTGNLTFMVKKFQLISLFSNGATEMRAAELAVSIGLMLSGSIPLMYFVEKIMSYFIPKDSSNLESILLILSTMTNVLVTFELFNKTKDENVIIKTSAFMVAGAFVLGDHLAFALNFQPTIILPLILSKLFAGFVSITISSQLIKRKDLKQYV